MFLYVFSYVFATKEEHCCYIRFWRGVLPFLIGLKCSCFVAPVIESSVSFAFLPENVPVLLHRLYKCSAFEGTGYRFFCICRRICSLLVVGKFRIFCINVPVLLLFGIANESVSISYGFPII